jgi:hypothetical protein
MMWSTHSRRIDPSTADASDAECPSALVLPALYPVRISVSSSLLAAAMNLKSSLREDPPFVSKVLTGNSLGSIGVVYGDIATSPLYALKEDLS